MTRRLNDAVFDGMKVIQRPDGYIIITCRCYKLKPLIPQDPKKPHAFGRKRAPGQWAIVDSLQGSGDWAWDHLHGPDHVTGAPTP